MKVGDYVRTKELGISRVKWFDNGEPILENGYTALQKDYKASPNIIDLIEVGDYVNGDKITSIGKDRNDEKVIYYEIPSDYGEDYYKNSEIKSIVTKEMYSSVEYRVENN